ncbi:hypothetical protein VIGAN_01490100, partial [Vigna angularis var. angularis]
QIHSEMSTTKQQRKQSTTTSTETVGVKKKYTHKSLMWFDLSVKKLLFTSTKEFIITEITTQGFSLSKQSLKTMKE